MLTTGEAMKSQLLYVLKETYQKKHGAVDRDKKDAEKPR